MTISDKQLDKEMEAAVDANHRRARMAAEGKAQMCEDSTRFSRHAISVIGAVLFTVAIILAVVAWVLHFT